MKDFWAMVAMVITFVLCMLLGKWMFEAVMASGLPDWMKYIILR